MKIEKVLKSVLAYAFVTPMAFGFTGNNNSNFVQYSDFPSQSEWQSMFGNLNSGSNTGSQIPSMGDFKQICESVVGQIGDAIDQYKSSELGDAQGMSKAADQLKQAIKSLKSAGYDTSKLEGELNKILEESKKVQTDINGILGEDPLGQIDCSDPASIESVLSSLEGDLDKLDSDAEGLANMVEQAMSQFDKSDFGADFQDLPSGGEWAEMKEMEDMPAQFKEMEDEFKNMQTEMKDMEEMESMSNTTGTWEGWDDKTGDKNGLASDLAELSGLMGSQSPFGQFLKK